MNMNELDVFPFFLLETPKCVSLLPRCFPVSLLRHSDEMKPNIEDDVGSLHFARRKTIQIKLPKVGRARNGVKCKSSK